MAITKIHSVLYFLFFPSIFGAIHLFDMLPTNVLLPSITWSNNKKKDKILRFNITKKKNRMRNEGMKTGYGLYSLIFIFFSFDLIYTYNTLALHLIFVFCTFSTNKQTVMIFIMLLYCSIRTYTSSRYQRWTIEKKMFYLRFN